MSMIKALKLRKYIKFIRQIEMCSTIIVKM